jgi:hypothetical protein
MLTLPYSCFAYPTIQKKRVGGMGEATKYVETVP